LNVLNSFFILPYYKYIFYLASHRERQENNKGLIKHAVGIKKTITFVVLDNAKNRIKNVIKKFKVYEYKTEKMEVSIKKNI